MKISVIQVMLRGRRRFMVSHQPKGKKRIRAYFKTKSEADTHADDLRLQQSQTGEAWMALTGHERSEILHVWHDAKQRGINLRAALDSFTPDIIANQRVQVAYDGFMAEKKAALVSDRTYAALKSNVGRFVATCSMKHLHEIARADLMAWLKDLKPRTFNTYLTSLKTFFGWCVKSNLLKKSPADGIDKINERRMPDLDKPPAVVSYDQCVKLLKATMDTDKGLIRYTSTCLLAGLRPEREAPKLNPAEDIGKEIHVRGRHAKDRQERYVPIVPALREWLKLGGDWPIKNLRRRFKAVREAAGLLDGWQSDCMRHTFASAFYAVYGAEATIKALGHGDYEMLFGHYRRLMSKEDGKRILGIRPE